MILLDNSNKFPWFTNITSNAKSSFWISYGVSILVNFNQSKRKNTGEKDRHESNSTNGVIKVDDVRVSLCGPVELGDVRNIESFRKLGPDVWTKTISKHESDIVSCVLFGWIRCQKIPTQLSDILSRCDLRQ